MINDKTFYAVGGFVRKDDGHRDNGFPNDRGGQIRANIKRVLDNGTLKVSVNYLNDHNGFYLPIPISDPRNPSVSLNQYIDYFDGTMNSPSLRNVTQKYLDSAGVLQTSQRDLANGRHLKFGNIGVQYDGEFGAWQVSAKGGHTKGRLNFDAFYSTSNPADATTFANGFLAASKAAFGAVSHLGYAIAGTNGAQVYSPASASGLVMQAQYRAIGSNFYSDQADLNLTRNFETGLGSHDVKFGFYGSSYGQTSKTAYNDMLIEVQGKPRTLDLIAYSASGAILGHVTDKGVLRYSTTLNQAEADAKMGALYLNDTWEVFDGLRIDGGIRKERYRYKGMVFRTKQVNLGDPATLADNTTRAFGDTLVQSHKTGTTNWTVGANYDFSPRFGAYARVSHLEVPPSMQVAASIAPLILTTKADQYEVGFKATVGRSYLYVTGFYTGFDPLNASFTAFNPVTGRNDQTVPFFGKAVVRGAELDGAFHLTDRFYINGSLTVQDPQYRDFVSATGADPSRVIGNQIIREPKVFGSIRPNFSFKAGDSLVELYGSYAYTGTRYVDFFMATELPAYHSIGAGVTVTRGDWKFQVVGDNLTNAKGLTEGNTRTDTLAGQGTQEAIYGRPVFGRNVRLVVSKAW
ncbi:MAG: TonB-dependent receptor [Pseudomonas sp.]|nr:TonB-dependent receptor [Pseudomonas sp.]